MRRDNRGFTLVELVVSLALLALILVPTASFFTNSFKVQSKSSMKTAITRVGQYVMENFKNKDYLGLTIVDGDSAKGLKDYVQETTISGLNIEDGHKITGETGWWLTYNDVEYVAEIELIDLEEHDISNVDIPQSFDGYVKINSNGTFENDNSYINQVSVGSTFKSPLNTTKNFTANYPTLILEAGYPRENAGKKATLLITNEDYFEDVADSEGNYNGTYEKSSDNQKYIRIIKGFKEEELEVYIEGINLLIKKGQEGDGASKEYTKITSSYIGEVSEDNTKRSPSEVLLKAKMTISYATDDSIRDTFEFSFPVDYDYSEEGE